MKEKPILFNGEMVNAILAGRKTQTRRVIKPQPHAGIRESVFVPSGLEDGHGREIKTPYRPDDRLWVRETWWHHKALYLEQAGFKGGTITKLECAVPGQFRANKSFDPAGYPHVWRKRPSIHMPRWASRITLEVVDVRVERVQDISEEDAEAEGVEPWSSNGWDFTNYYNSFASLWNSINAKRGFGWDVNPWVYVIEFRRVEDEL